MIIISDSLTINYSDIKFKTSRSSGAGGQHVNKVETAVILRFNINNSSLSGHIKVILLTNKGANFSSKGEIIIKSDKWKSQIKNKQETVLRLKKIILKASIPKVSRKATTHTKSSKEKRLNIKKQKSEIKNKRKKISLNNRDNEY